MLFFFIAVVCVIIYLNKNKLDQEDNAGYESKENKNDYNKSNNSGANRRPVNNNYVNKSAATRPMVKQPSKVGQTPSNTQQISYNNKKEVVEEPKEKIQVKKKRKIAKTDSVSQDTKLESSTKVEYASTENEYNYVAEYPDTTHIWDEIGGEINLDGHGMLKCTNCGTENLIVRDAMGKCLCYYCQKEL